ncbi:hypothetical protein OKW30_008244 [Paraburkholderia sp. Clong3]|uniref:hypothetical protein n=1 Tax=Paraburkholderia sp. Clong3 TaxID=2991061 RepID=UPI003D1B55DD
MPRIETDPDQSFWHCLHVNLAEIRTAAESCSVDDDQASSPPGAYAVDARRHRHARTCSKDTMRSAPIASILFALLLMYACRPSSMPGADQEVDAAFADVLDLYNERLDLTAQASGGRCASARAGEPRFEPPMRITVVVRFT